MNVTKKTESGFCMNLDLEQPFRTAAISLILSIFFRRSSLNKYLKIIKARFLNVHWDRTTEIEENRFICKI